MDGRAEREPTGCSARGDIADPGMLILVMIDAFVRASDSRLATVPKLTTLAAGESARVGGPVDINGEEQVRG